jgi:hypothetical protein
VLDPFGDAGQVQLPKLLQEAAPLVAVQRFPEGHQVLLADPGQIPPNVVTGAKIGHTRSPKRLQVVYGLDIKG